MTVSSRFYLREEAMADYSSARNTERTAWGRMMLN